MKQSLLKKLWLRTSLLVAVILCGAGTAWGQKAKIGDVEYETLAAAVDAATGGQQIDVVTAGTYTLPNLPQNITINGAVDGVVFTHTSGGNICSVSNGATFKNVAFNFEDVNYHGFQHAGTINMEGCVINGRLTSYGDMNFTNCQLVKTDGDYNMWVYGKGTVNYTNCTFTGNGKFLHCYSESSANIATVNIYGCKFINTGAANKAAINVKSTCGTTPLEYHVTVTNCTTEGAFPAASTSDALIVFNELIQVDDRKSTAVDNITINQDGTQLYAKGASTLIEIGTVDELKAFRDAVNAGTSYAGKTVKLAADLDLSGEANWEPIGNVAAYPGKAFKGTFDGAGHTISHLTIDDQTVNWGRAALFGSASNATIKNLNITDVDIKSHHYAGAIVAYKGDGTNVTIENCHVKNGSIVSTPELLSSGSYNNGDKVGAILGYGANPTTIDGCSAENINISGYRDLGSIAGFINGTVTNCTAKDVTIVQDNKNGYKTEDLLKTCGEIVGGRSANAATVNSESTYSNVVITQTGYVAQIGEQKYETLQAALDAAEAAEPAVEDIVIDLLDDAELTIAPRSDRLAIGTATTKSITINGNDHKLAFMTTDTDWNDVSTRNDDQTKLVLNDMTIDQGGVNTQKTWNSYDINFNCAVELNNVTSNRPIAFKNNATLKDVTISDTSGDYYGIWISPRVEGQNISIDGLTLTAGRGIKVDDEYVDNPEKVTLDIANATFNTTKKAAILVKSKADTDITVGENVNIENVAADKTNAVWVDEDNANLYGLVSVEGATMAPESSEADYAAKIVSGDKTQGYYKTFAAAVAAAEEGQTVVVIAAGSYTLPSISKNITVEGAVEGVVFNHPGAGNVAAIPNGATFKNVTFNFGNSNYHGFQTAGTINMEGCTLNGKLFSYGDMNFTECEFENAGDYNMWVYGAGNVVYDQCTFTNTTKGKLLHLYCEDANQQHKVTVKNCKFINKGELSKSAINVKATCEAKLLQYELYLEGNNTYEGNFPTAVGEQDNQEHTFILSPLAQVDDRSVTPDNITVYEDGKLIYPIVVSTPIIFHDGGEYEGELTVAIAGEGVKYTLNSGAEQTYSAPFSISENTTVKAWAEKDGVKSDEVEKTFTIVAKQAGAEVADGYYNIKTSDGKYVNVAGRKTVTLASDTKSAGTVIRVSADANGVKVLRSQAVDLPRYAERAMSYVPEIVKEVVNKLAGNVDDPIIGEQGTQLILDKFNKEFDYHLYLEGENNTYRIYGRTPSMKPVVDFYAENKELIDGRLLKVEGFVKEVLQKVVDKVGRGQSVVDMFKVKTIWQNMGGTLTEPTDDASTLKFYEEVLSSEKNVWEFAYQTGMLYWEKVKGYLTENAGSLGDYGKYLEKIPNVRPNFRYYIVPGENGVDIISEGNSQITDASTAWTLTKREGFDVTLPVEKVVNIYPTSSGGSTYTYNEYYGTLYTDFAYQLPADVVAYKIDGIDVVKEKAYIKKTKLENILPAQTPVMLVSNTADIELTLVAEDVAAVSEGELRGNDYLINEYEINSSQAEGIMMILQKLSESLYNEYEHLQRRNAGTVNNKYFFGLAVEPDLGVAYKAKTGNEMEETPVRVLTKKEDGTIAFTESWNTLAGNESFIFNEQYPDILLSRAGDVNRDGQATIADVTALVNIVLGKVVYPRDNDKYDFEAANVNGDEQISIADVTALVNIILGK